MLNDGGNLQQPMAWGGPGEASSPHGSPTAGRHRRVRQNMTDDEILTRELKVTNFIVTYPKTIIGSCLAITIALAAVVLVGIGLTVTNTTLIDRNDFRTDNLNAMKRSTEQIDDQAAAQRGGQQVLLLRSAPMFAFFFVYDDDDGNTLTLDNLKFIRSTEAYLQDKEDFSDHCVLQWLPSTSRCPGVDCPWYRKSWDHTLNNPTLDSSKQICAPAIQSLTWVMWHMRIVDANTTNPCDPSKTFAKCVDQGEPLYITLINDGRTFAEKQAAVNEKGGVEPTEVEVNAFIRLFARLRFQPGYRWLTPFFGKQFGDPKLEDSDPRKWASSVSRGNIRFGGPIERFNPKLRPGCATKTADACKESAECEWTTTGGLMMNATGCVPKQYTEVGTDEDGDEAKDQIEIFADWAEPATEHYDNLDGPVDVLYFSTGAISKKFLEIILRDSLLAMVSVAFVYLYLQIHTGSFFLATLGMIQVLMPFPLGYFVYKVIFRVDGFYGLSVLALYIVLAIGADDIFVFMDNWVQTDTRPRPDNCTYMKGRMARTWKTSGTAMGITSTTTMAAFIATMTSPLLEIKVFGLFAAILVFFDYALVMTFFAAAVVVYHRNYENTVGCCCCGATMCGNLYDCCTCYSRLLTSQTEPACMEAKLIQPRTFESLDEARLELGPELDGTFQKPDPNGLSSSVLPPGNTPKSAYVLLVIAGFVYLGGFTLLQNDRTSGGTSHFNYMALIILGLGFFCSGMNMLRTHKARQGAAQADGPITSMAPFFSGSKGLHAGIRLIPAVLLTAGWIVMILMAVKLHPTTKNDQFLPDWHPIQRFLDALQNDFPSNDQDNVLKVQVAFGLNVDDPIDRSGTDVYDPDDIGKPIFSNYPAKQQDFQDPKFQLFVKAFCEQTLAKSQQGALLQRTLLQEKDQNCLMTGFEAWQASKGKPFPSTSFLSDLWDFTMAEANGPSRLGYNTYFDKVLFKTEGSAKNGLKPVGIELVYVEFNTTLKEFGNSYESLEEQYDVWVDWIAEANEGSAQWVKAVYPSNFVWQGQMLQASPAWTWMHTQSLLVSGAINGTIISLILAAAIVLIASLNIITTVLVLLELVGVVGYVLGSAYLMGWELGMIESVSITILVGLSVDYVVHFAIHYSHVKVPESATITSASFGDQKQISERQLRVHEVVAEMGPTVLGGAMTSIGASLVLLCTWVQFFYKFGVIFMLTVAFSFVWSFLFFLPMMSVFGPEKDFLGLKPLFAKLCPGLCGKKQKNTYSPPSPDQGTKMEPLLTNPHSLQSL